MEIEKLEKRKARYQERSPTPPVVGIIDEDLEDGYKTNLKVPSSSPFAKKNGIDNSSSKTMFMNSMGLCKANDDQKIGKIWKFAHPTSDQN